MCDNEDYLICYREFFENFAATVNHEDQLPVHIAGYTITEAELPGEVLYWTTQYLTEKQCPLTLMTPLLRIILDEVRLASKKQPNEFGYKSDELVYIALRLMQAVTARVNAICLRYLDNAMLDSLPPPPPLNQRDLKTVSIANKNSRRVMEDRHVEIGNLEAIFGIETTEPTSFYAVYDGHAGSAAATYCAAHLHQYLVDSSHFTNNLKAAMNEAFLKTDADFVRKSNQERANGGSTAVTIAVRGRRLLAAWAGDSQALLAKRMRLMQLVRPHKPEREDERDRIEQTGGTVMFWGTWRVNGQLAVSRAIGDAQYKPYVTALPEMNTVELDGDEDFVVVASDGLWDFVSEDDVALAVYRQIAVDPDDLKAVTKRLVVQAKRQGSADNISIIVVFLKDPRAIAADNCPPMDLGLDNALASAPPFVMDTETCKRLDPVQQESECADADNGVDNSDSDSEDLGPETAVDADDIDADRNHHPAPATPPAHTVELNQVDGGLVDNVAESGDESEDEWNYFKGEGEQQNDEPDELPLSDTPCQDNSAWESSSVDMNSSPLNPDAPVFVPGSVGDVLLAESPRKPLPMDDIELPDVAQFRTEAVVRPAELLDLDNCDQLNGHHNISMEGVKEHLNGNEKCDMDSLGFGFNVGIESDKVTDTGLIQDFERIQKDTTDFCNIQVFQAHTETNPFATEGNEELLERLKNKERDPMSMSFYQEKDDDTCERLLEGRVDLNAVQPLPDSEDESEDAPHNGNCDKENLAPHSPASPASPDSTPDNDVLRFPHSPDHCANLAPHFAQTDNFMDFTATNNMHNFSNIEFDSNIPQDIVQTDTPESHKLLFEQIPEIPDGKSSELGFVNEDTQDPSESDKDIRATTPQEDTSQDVEMESKLEESPCEETQPEPIPDIKEDHFEPPTQTEQELTQEHHLENHENEIVSDSLHGTETLEQSAASSPLPTEEEKRAFSPEVSQENIIVDVHHESQSQETRQLEQEQIPVEDELECQIPEIQLSHVEKEEDIVEVNVEAPVGESPVPASPFPAPSPAPSEGPEADLRPADSPAPETPAPVEELPCVAASPAPVEEAPCVAASPTPVEEAPCVAASPAPEEEAPCAAASPVPVEEALFVAASPVPVEEDLFVAASPAPVEEAPCEALSPAPVDSPADSGLSEAASPLPEDSQPAPDLLPEEAPRCELVTDLDLPEHRAQEICLPVTCHIEPEPAPEAEPEPAPAAPAAPLSDTPIAADPAAVAVAAAAVAATAATVATVATAKIKAGPPTVKKSPTSASKAAPKPAPRTTPAAARTPLSAAKKTASPATAAPRTPRAAPSPAKPAPRTTPAKPAAAAAAPAKPASAAAPKPVPKVAPAKTTSTVPARPATKLAPPKSQPNKEPAPRAAARPAPRPAAAPARPATAPARPAAPRPAPPKAAPASAARPAPRPLTDRKPLSAPKSAPTRISAAPISKSAPAARPAAPPRARAPLRDADKQNKDLANRRLAAPARATTAAAAAAAKAPISKNGPIKSVPKKPIESIKPQNGLTNGAAELKAPPPDTALPDVIA